MKNRYINIASLLILALSLIVSSCSKDSDPGAAPRLFRPVNLAGESIDNIIVATWTPVPNAVAYQIQCSVSEDFATIARDTTFVGAQVATGTINKLDYSTAYYVRIRSISDMSKTADSEWFVRATTIKTKASESIILPLAAADIYADNVTLRWNPNFAVTKVVIKAQGAASAKDYPIADATSLMLSVSNLTPNTKYSATIYMGASKCNEAEFTTWHTTPAEAVVIADGADLNAAIEAAAPDAVLLLEQGSIYTIAEATALLFSKNITLMSNSPGNMPQIVCNTNGNVTSGVTRLKFLGIAFTASSTISVLSPAAGALAINSIEFNSCSITGFGNAAVRLQSGISTATQIIDEIIFDNCVMSGVTGSYYVIQSKADDNNWVKKGVYKSSTFYNMARGLYRNEAATNNAVTIEVDGCTFYEIVGSEAFIRLDKCNGARVSILNSLFTKSKSSSAGGVRLVDAVNLTMANNYGTNDYLQTDATSSNNRVIEMKTITAPATGVFVDPAVGNFTVIDALLKENKVGDPRWLR